MSRIQIFSSSSTPYCNPQLLDVFYEFRYFEPFNFIYLFSWFLIETPRSHKPPTYLPPPCLFPFTFPYPPPYSSFGPLTPQDLRFPCSQSPFSFSHPWSLQTLSSTLYYSLGVLLRYFVDNDDKMSTSLCPCLSGRVLHRVHRYENWWHRVYIPPKTKQVLLRYSYEDTNYVRCTWVDIPNTPRHYTLFLHGTLIISS